MSRDITNKEQSKHIKTEKFDITLTKEGMLKVVYTEGTKINIDVVLQIEEKGNLLLGEQKAYMLIDASLASGVTKKAFRYLQETKEYQRIGGFAILTKSFIGRIMGNFFY